MPADSRATLGEIVSVVDDILALVRRQRRATDFRISGGSQFQTISSENNRMLAESGDAPLSVSVRIWRDVALPANGYLSLQGQNAGGFYVSFDESVDVVLSPRTRLYWFLNDGDPFVSWFTAASPN